MAEKISLMRDKCSKDLVLLYLSYLWLAFPYFLFIFNYYKSYMIILTIIALALMFYDSFTQNNIKSFFIFKTFDFRIQFIKILILFIISMLFLSLQGVIEPFFFNSDWFKSFAIYDFLANNIWTSLLSINGENYFLRYSFGLFLPAAFFQNIFPLTSNFYLYLYEVFGLAIVFAWIVKIINPSNYMHLFLLPFAFLLFSGPDILGIIMCDFGLLPYSAKAESLLSASNAFPHIEWWSSIISISSNTTLLFWVPQHALPTWISLLVFYFNYHQEDENFLPLPAILFLSTLLFYFSPLSFVGLFLLIPLWISYAFSKNGKVLFLSWPSLSQIILAMFLVVPLLVFYSSGNLVNKIAINKGDFMMVFYDVLLEVGIYAISLYFIIDNKKDRILLYYIFIISLLSSFFKMGDEVLALKISIASTMLLSLLFLKYIYKNINPMAMAGFKNTREQVLIIFILLAYLVSILTPFQEINRALFAKNIE